MKTEEELIYERYTQSTDKYGGVIDKLEKFKERVKELPEAKPNKDGEYELFGDGYHHSIYTSFIDALIRSLNFEQKYKDDPNYTEQMNGLLLDNFLNEVDWSDILSFHKSVNAPKAKTRDGMILQGVYQRCFVKGDCGE
jgi:hypothetical protein